MTPRKPDLDAIERALAYHQAEGRIQWWQRNDANPRQRWVITGNSGTQPSMAFLSDREAHAAAWALSSAAHARGEVNTDV
jgi:hypothetical protein